MNLIVLLQSVDVLLSKRIVDSIQLHFCFHKGYFYAPTLATFPTKSKLQ